MPPQQPTEKFLGWLQWRQESFKYGPAGERVSRCMCKRLVSMVVYARHGSLGHRVTTLIFPARGFQAWCRCKSVSCMILLARGFQVWFSMQEGFMQSSVSWRFKYSFQCKSESSMLLQEGFSIGQEGFKYGFSGKRQEGFKQKHHSDHFQPMLDTLISVLSCSSLLHYNIHVYTCML